MKSDDNRLKVKKPPQRKGEKNGIRHCGFGCDSFSVCNCFFSSANIKNFMTTTGNRVMQEPEWKGDKNGTYNWSFGCSSFSVCDSLFSSADIKKRMQDNLRYHRPCSKPSVG